MRRLKKVRIKPVIIGSHPSFYNKMEELRKEYESQSGIKLSQIQITNIFAKKINIPRMCKSLDLISPGGKNVRKKERRPY